jgi:hypothetical protein
MRADACFLQALASFETNTRAAETGKQDTGKEINFLQSRKLTVKVFYEGGQCVRLLFRILFTIGGKASPCFYLPVSL